jgi:3-oxoacyl-[acyl-carrier protein] reductase
MNLGIQNRTAIVTGASKGMGLATARTLAAEGVRVLMVARTAALLEEAGAEVRAEGGVVETLAGDVADIALPVAAIQKCQKLWGSVDILINNAGGPPMGSFLEHDDAAWSAVLQTNLLSVVRFSRAAAALMKAQRWGRIVSITSTVAKEPSPAMVLSATARAGVAAFTKAIAIELAPFNVSANVICPGGVLTDRLVDLLKVRATRENCAYEDLLKDSQASIPAGRFASPREVADLIVFLVSDRGGYVNGVSLSVDGALTKGFT